MKLRILPLLVSLLLSFSLFGQDTPILSFKTTLKDSGGETPGFSFTAILQTAVQVDWGNGNALETFNPGGQTVLLGPVLPGAANEEVTVTIYGGPAAIKSIILSNKQITEINLVQGQCEYLDDIRCTYNNLTSLDVSAAPNLVSLYCFNNQLTGLDVSNNTKLIELKVGENNLESLNIASNLNLTTLSVEKNPSLGNDDLVLSENILKELIIGSCAFTSSLDLTDQSALEVFGCGENQLTGIDLSNSASLNTLRCAYNALTSVKLHPSVELVEMQCNNNKLSFGSFPRFKKSGSAGTNFSYSNQSAFELKYDDDHNLDLSKEYKLAGPFPEIAAMESNTNIILKYKRSAIIWSTLVKNTDYDVTDDGVYTIKDAHIGKTIRAHMTNSAYGSMELISSELLVTENIGVGIGDETTADKFSVYPNPFAEELTVKSEIGSLIELISVQGMVVYSQVTDKETETLSLGNMPSGIYIVRLTCQGEVHTQKVVKL